MARNVELEAADPDPSRPLAVALGYAALTHRT
jgi:hypothetical protein